MAANPAFPSGQGGVSGRWRVVGVTGVTGGGKTTLAYSLLSVLPSTTVYVGQDEYILPNDHPCHPKAPVEIGGLNKETLASIDMAKMVADMKTILASDPASIPLSDWSSLLERGNVIGSALPYPRPPPRGQRGDSRLPGVLLVDGFLLFGHPEVLPLCHLRYCLTLTWQQCFDRRSQRVFTVANMNNQHYFDLCVWPAHEGYLAHTSSSVSGLHFLDGAAPPDTIRKRVVKEVLEALEL